MSSLKVIISGGGTGGHIFPAIAIANALKKAEPNAEFLFVGALGKMEMEKVPKAGYQIVGLPIMGLQRRLTMKNLAFPFKVLNSLMKARSVIRRFKPDVAIGVGGYASGPLLHQAASAGIPCVIQEQNSYPGITNKLLAKKAEKICVAYPNMDRFFPKEKLVLTGNPVRELIKNTSAKRAEALKTFDLDSKLKTVLVIGGSLGARTINESIKSFLQHNTTPIQLIWQTGKAFFQQAQNEAQQATVTKARVFDFIERMDLAYGAADVIISRAGALSVSELCVVGKPAILIPSPNVSEDHQTKNAMALVEKKAAVLVTDSNARSELANALLNLLNNDTVQLQLATNISKLALPDADDTIAAEILKTCTTKPAHS